MEKGTLQCWNTIQSLLQVCKELEIDKNDEVFAKEYAMFENSGSICNELKNICSIARMQTVNKNLKTNIVMYKDALKVLGIPDDYACVILHRSKTSFDSIVFTFITTTSAPFV